MTTHMWFPRRRVRWGSQKLPAPLRRSRPSAWELLREAQQACMHQTGRMWRGCVPTVGPHDRATIIRKSRSPRRSHGADNISLAILFGYVVDFEQLWTILCIVYGGAKQYFRPRLAHISTSEFSGWKMKLRHLKAKEGKSNTQEQLLNQLHRAHQPPAAPWGFLYPNSFSGVWVKKDPSEKNSPSRPPSQINK